MLKLLGQDNVSKFLPFSTEVLAKVYQKDPYFNNLPLCCWDTQAEYLCSLYIMNKITCWSLSESVSLLKHCAVK